MKVIFSGMHVHYVDDEGYMKIYSVPKIGTRSSFRDWATPIDRHVTSISIWLDSKSETPEENWTLSMVEPAHPSEHAPKDGS